MVRPRRRVARKMALRASAPGRRSFHGLAFLRVENNGLRATPRNGFMAAFRVIGAVATDARDRLVHANLVEQTRQYRRVAGGVVGHLDGPDLQRGGVYAQVHLAPLTAILGAMLFSLPLSFTNHLDAGAVDQQVQAGRRRVGRDRHREMLLPPTDGAEI